MKKDKRTSTRSSSKKKSPEVKTTSQVTSYIVMCTHCGSDDVTPFVEGSDDFSCNSCETEFSIN